MVQDSGNKKKSSAPNKGARKRQVIGPRKKPSVYKEDNNGHESTTDAAWSPSLPRWMTATACVRSAAREADVADARASLNVKELQEAIDGLKLGDLQSYADYWMSLTPQSTVDVWKRWAFAFLSVYQEHTKTVESYRLLESLALRPSSYGRQSYVPLPLEDWLKAASDSKAGLAKNFVNLHAFSKEYWKRPDFWQPSWTGAKPASGPTNHHAADSVGFLPMERRRMYDEFRRLGLKGMGMAKISFLIELLRPANEEVVCLDRHTLRMMGMSGEETNSLHDDIVLYEMVERVFVEVCLRSHGGKKKPVMARHVLWDQKVGKPLTRSRYWSYCLEDRDHSVRLDVEQVKERISKDKGTV